MTEKTLKAAVAELRKLVDEVDRVKIERGNGFPVCLAFEDIGTYVRDNIASWEAVLDAYRESGWRPITDTPADGRWIVMTFGAGHIVPHFWGGCSTLKYSKGWCYLDDILPSHPKEAAP